MVQIRTCAAAGRSAAGLLPDPAELLARHRQPRGLRQGTPDSLTQVFLRIQLQFDHRQLDCTEARPGAAAGKPMPTSGCRCRLHVLDSDWVQQICPLKR